MVVVEKGVPVPSRRITHSDRYAFRLLDIGDSYLIPLGDEQETRNQASRWKMRNPGFNFVTRKEDDRIRIWRTA